mmetsp:Transcript_15004/g.49200  ORF Transcript_15004/g.49200 Transcript_15004/m.49200 type:complete len:399 (-) Transcript_15004:195-1391(-)
MAESCLTRTGSRSEGFASDEVIEHVQRVRGLVHRDHVPGLEDPEKGERPIGGGLAGDVARGGCPVCRLCPAKLARARPFHRLGPGVIANPVANQVLVARVDEDAKLRLEDGGNVLFEVHHPVGKESCVRRHCALAPLVPFRPESLLHLRFVGPRVERGKVVAEPAVVTLFADVVHIHRSFERGHRRDIDGLKHRELARLHSQHAHLGAANGQRVREPARLDRGGAQAVVRALNHVALRLADEVVLLCEGCVRSILPKRLDQTVPYGHALEIDLHVRLGEVLGQNFVRDRRDVMPGVRFSRHEKRCRLELRKLREKLEEEVVQVLRHLLLVRDQVCRNRAVRVSRTHRLIDEQEMGAHVPAVGVVCDYGTLRAIQLVRSILLEESQLARAPRTSAQPQD